MGKVADGLVGSVKYAHGKKAWLSAIALLLVLVLATLWIMVNALRFNPFVGTYLVSVDLPESGGLLADQDVTLRGVAVGKVDDLTLTPSGVHATLRLNNGIHIPDTTGIRVSGLSAAGEQYVNLDGDGDGARCATAASSTAPTPSCRSAWPTCWPTATGSSSSSTPRS